MNFQSYLILVLYGLSFYLLLCYINLVYCVEYLLHFLEEPIDGNYYDYIIIGCGTAGSLIAHQLSRLENVSFIVLEAGGYDGPFLQPPVLGPLLQHSSFDWQYKTIPQDFACLGFKDMKCSWPMGKIVGGSAKLNNMIHIRSYLNELVPWFGNKYSFEDLESLLIDLETDLPYNNIRYKTELSTAILKAGAELGFDIINTTTHNKIGFLEPVVNQLNGARWSTSHMLLKTLFGSNGDVATNAFVHQIIFHDTDRSTVKGVLLERFGENIHIYSRQSVILSAGAIGSPKLLLLSGIGPKEHLRNMNISLVKNLPVGDNLMDHVTTGLDLVTLKQSLHFSISNILNPLSAWKYFTNGEGPWTSAGCEAVAFLDLNNSSNLTKVSSTPNLQLMVLPLGLATDYGFHLKNIIGITDHVWKSYFSKVIHKNSVTILPIVLHPKSKGKVYLSSNDPYDPPLIDPRYFTKIEDVDLILKGIDIIKKILKTKAMKELSAELNPIPFPGCQQEIFDSNEYWICYVQHLTLTTFHPVGTCKMGSSDDETSVVNYDFSIKGINNLYVVDASVFPTMVSGNINMGVALLAKIFSQRFYDKNHNSYT